MHPDRQSSPGPGSPLPLEPLPSSARGCRREGKARPHLVGTSPGCAALRARAPPARRAHLGSGCRSCLGRLCRGGAPAARGRREGQGWGEGGSAHLPDAAAQPIYKAPFPRQPGSGTRLRQRRARIAVPAARMLQPSAGPTRV